MNALYRLEGTICKNCSTVYFPARKLCPDCRRKGRIEKTELSGNGQIYSYTIVHTAPAGFELQQPYALAIVKLDEGPMITAQIVDCNFDDISIGKQVSMVFRKIHEGSEKDIIQYGYKFRIVEGVGRNKE
jgi:hypothetical protein